MAETTVQSTLPDSAIDVIVRDIGQILSGAKPDKNRLKDTFWAAFTASMFESIHDGFLEKSERRKDELGIKWKPLARSTIAQRPIRRGEKKALGITGRRTRGLLTKEQDKLWRAIFRSRFIQLAPRIGEAAAKAEAGKLAWAILKSRGAQTKLEVLGNRVVPIGIVTGELERSLKPAKVRGPSYRPRKGQVFRQVRGGIEIGTSVLHAGFFHADRELWPEGDKLSIWIDRATSAGVQAAVERLAKIFVQRG